MTRIASLLLLFPILVALSIAQGELPRKGWFGGSLQPLTPEQRTKAGVAEGGLALGSILPGGSAEKAGLLKDDILLELDGKPITGAPMLGAIFNETPAGKVVVAKIFRDGKTQEIRVPVAEKPRDKGEGYEVIYDHVVSHGARIRTLVSRPSGFPGKRPVLFLIQGIGYSSQDSALTGGGPYARILKAFSDKGYVTVRVDKPGLGDSEGGPANEVDFERDTDAFRQALKSLPKYDFVDPERILIFGHSMGGCQGPILAAETPVAGLAVYGTVVRTWEEYCIENTRRQALLGGSTFEKVDQDIRPLIGAISLIMTGGMEPADVKAKFPQYARGVDMFMPDGRTMSGIPLAFWRQCFAVNYAEHWTKVQAPILTMWGENEFIASRIDHPLIAELVNKLRPGTAEYVEVPDADHAFKRTSSVEDSFRRWTQGGEFNPNSIEILLAWAEKVLARSRG